MGRIVVTEFISLDGVIEDPGGAEDFKHGGWTFEVDNGEEGSKFKLDEALEAEALLLGRVTYEGFAAAWPSMHGEFADHFGAGDQIPGPDPQRSDYGSFLSFSEPDGNSWMVQEVRRAEPGA